MKQTIKTLVITLGKKVWAALLSAVAMLIGETILSFFSKGFTKFRANREARKVDTTETTATEQSEAEITEDVIPEELNADTTDTDMTDND